MTSLLTITGYLLVKRANRDIDEFSMKGSDRRNLIRRLEESAPPTGTIQGIILVEKS